MSEPRDAVVCLDGWNGRTETPVKVVGETPKRYRIQALQRMRLGGRCRWLYVGEQALVPKSSVRFVQ